MRTSRGDRAMQGSGSVYIDIFQIIPGTRPRRRIDPRIAAAGVPGQGAVHQQRRTADQRRIQADAISILFAINVESEIVRFAASLPDQQGTAWAVLPCYRLGGERLEADCRGSNNGFGFR